VPVSVRQALADAADAPGYPATYGTAALREAAAAWMERELEVSADPAAVLPLIGSKELVAGLPGLLGLGPGDAVAYPAPAYPTYEVGALLAGARPVPVSDERLLGDEGWGVGGEDSSDEGSSDEGSGDEGSGIGSGEVKLLWLNSPANPHGRVHSAEVLRRVVDRARSRGVLIASDECYITLGWEGARPLSVLHPEVCGGSHEGLLAVHSLSKRSNLAGYRSAFLSGDPAVVAEMLEVRKHAGMMSPAPIQAATIAALGDQEHAAAQKELYRARRAVLRQALESAGYRIDHSEAGLYLWASRIVDGKPEPCWDTLAQLAGLGILAAPGEFYGPGGEHHVRLALTASDERVAAAAARLTG
jgi:aspartate/methionine/tyrosine aminotransferase